jgi:solute carrier family 30 (zinc transporter), member 2
LETIEGVKKVHDLRIWALTMDKGTMIKFKLFPLKFNFPVAISVHLEIDPTADSQQILKATTQMLRRDFNVHESTIQIEGYLPETENCHQCIMPSK